MGNQFFSSEQGEDLAYINVRDLPHLAEAREFVESLWTRYRGYHDPHFLEDARNHFIERLWEMYLAVTLLERGFQLIRYGTEGPEFYFLHDGRKVWTEAVAPGPGRGRDRVAREPIGQAFTVPTEAILLRFTNALAEKRGRYLAARQKGIIDDSDLYVLAVNSRRIPHAPFGNTLPFFVQAYLPIGDLSLMMDRATGKLGNPFYKYRDAVSKASGAAVRTDSFLDPNFSFVSAILHSAVDCVNRPNALGGEFAVLHNPNAVHPLDPAVFSWCKQFFHRGEFLEVIEAGDSGEA